MRNVIINYRSRLTSYVVAIFLLCGLPMTGTIAGNELNNVAFPEKFMIRLSSYHVNDADTDIKVFSSAGVGTGVNFDKDLGGENSVTIPRIDAYYRFNANHRIDFSSFRTERDGLKTIDIDIVLGDQSFVVGDSVESKIKFSLTRLGYAYSFYHSPNVELSLTAGLNINSYDFEYSLASDASSSSSDASGPLPTFGLRLAYKISPKWSLRYVSETFFIEIDDALKGTLLNYELDVEYRLNNSFVLGAGIARTSTDLDVDDGDWEGSISDSNRGLLVYGAYYF